MLHIENRLTAPVPKLDGRTTLDTSLTGSRRAGLRSWVGLMAFCAGVTGTVLWLTFVAWCLFRLARLVVG